jgi:hypothetical protein
MNEPPTPDMRATLVVVGVALSLLALAQVPYVRRLPLIAAALTAGAVVGSFFAHTHAYPGRTSIHLVPLATAMSTCAASRLAAACASRSRRAIGGVMSSRTAQRADDGAPARI